MKYGIIGYGKMGQIRHQAMRANGLGDPSAIHDVAPDTTHTNLYRKTPEQIIEDPTLDAVVLCTPNFLNKDLTIAALKAGKHVFCEKPPAFNSAEVEEIIDAENKCGRILMYGFNHRHHGGSRKMAELVASGDFGRVLWMRGRYGKSVDEGYLETWRAKPHLAGGGILIDQGIHMVDLFLQIGGQDFDEIHAFVSSLYWNLPGIEDNVFAIFRNSTTGQCASLHSTMTQWRHLFSFEVFLERGYCVLNGLKTPSGTYGSESLSVARNRTKAPAATWEDEDVFEYAVDDSWNREMLSFIEAVQSGQPVKHRDSREALRVMQHIDRIYANERHEHDQLFNDLNGGR
ncbi:MAG: Gfo/Idh/MocA family oxidoreductase [Pseudomonadota bacterium]